MKISRNFRKIFAELPPNHHGTSVKIFAELPRNFHGTSTKWSGFFDIAQIRCTFVHVICARMCTRANFCNLIREAPLRLKICMIVVLSEENILTKSRANQMHAVHVVHMHVCARGQILAIFRLMRLKICRSVLLVRTIY